MNARQLCRLDAVNFKGSTFEILLDDFNVLVGDNLAGKSTRIEALVVLFLGHLPSLGKRPSDTFKLASGRELIVRGYFGELAPIVRRFYLDGDSVKTDHTIPDWFAPYEKDGIVATMLDATTYFGLSARERSNYVASKVPLAQASLPNRSELIEDLAVALYATEGLDSTSVADFMSELAKDALDASTDPQAFLDSMIALVAQHRKSARGTAVVMEKSAQGLAHLRAQDPVRDEDLARIERDLAAKRTELEALREEKVAKTTAFELARTARRRRQALTAEKAQRDRAVAARDAVRSRIEDQERKLAEVPEVDLARVEVELREAETAATRSKIELSEVVESIKRNQIEFSKLANAESCPCCGAKNETWKDAKLAEIESALAGLATKREQLAEHSDLVCEHAEREHHRVQRARSEHHRRGSLATALVALKGDLALRERDVAQTDHVERDLAELPAETPGAEEALNDVQTRMNVINDELANLERNRRTLDGRRMDLARLAAAEKAREDARKTEAVAKVAEEALRERQGKLVAEIFEKLLLDANALFAGVFPPLAYNRAESELGRWRDGTWVSHETFAGAEKRIAYVALQAALATRAPFRLMLLDEMGTIHPNNIGLIADRIARLLSEGRIDQFVGVDLGRVEVYSRAASKASVGFVASPLLSLVVR